MHLDVCVCMFMLFTFITTRQLSLITLTNRILKIVFSSISSAVHFYYITVKGCMTVIFSPCVHVCSLEVHAQCWVWTVPVGD